MTIRKFITVSMVAFSLVACAEQGGPITKSQMGTVLGAVGGAALGSQFGKGSGKTAMVALGALGGAALGNSVGASLDNADKAAMGRVSQQTFETIPTGQTRQWSNPDSGNYGTFTPTRTIQAPSGEVCREFTQTIVVGGKKQQGYGKACRQGDGSWQIVQ
jgi:surface antigen